MFKVMLVDDEALILNGLKILIDWGKLDLQIEYTVSNGEDALELFKKSSVDIIITDITMPKLNGLDLIKEIKKINDNTRFIILSGYDDFDYAKQAISLGIENYILKPINEEELEATLKNTIEKLNIINRQPIIEGKKLEMLKENILYRWAKNNISFYELEERNEVLEIDLLKDYYGVGILKLDVNRNNKFEESQYIYTIIKSLIKKQELGEAFNDLDCGIVCIFGNNNQSVMEEKIKLFFEELIRLVKVKYDINSFVSLGTIKKGYKNTYKSYEEAKYLQDYSLISGFNKIINYTDEIKEKKIGTAEEYVEASEMNKVLLTKNEQSIDNYIEEVFNRPFSSKGITPEDIHNTAIKMLLILNDISNEMGILMDKDDENIKESILEICKIGTLDELKLLLKKKCFSLVNKMNSNFDERSPILKRVISYVKENYSEEISLKTLGHKYNINPSYLGQIFYKELGEQFSDYLNKIRNQRAKELLLNTNLKINEIARKVGYTDNSYFYKKFKELYGVSPNTLRNTKNY